MVKTKENKKPVSLQKKVIGPQIIFLAVQLAILLFCFLGLGIISSARNNEINKLSTTVDSRSVQIQKFFGNISINASYASSKIESEMQKTLDQTGEASVFELLKNEAHVEAFQDKAMTDLISALEYSGTSGAFIILDTDRGDGKKAALYLRDTQPQTVSSKDLLFLRGPYTIARKYSVKLDSDWVYWQNFADGPDNSFYTKPIEAAKKSPDGKIEQYGYWSSVFQLSSGHPIITYTLPLLDQMGRPYGVLGFDVDEDLAVKNLPADEIPYANGVYALYKDSRPGSLPRESIFSGAYASVFKSGPEQVLLTGSGQTPLARINLQQNPGAMLGTRYQLDLYSPDAYFAGEKWALIGMVPQNELYSVWYMMIEVLIIAFILALIIGLAGIFRSGAVFARPITALAKKVRAANPKEPVELGKTNIAEIDDLTVALEKMSSDVAQAASRLSKIIGLVGLPLGGYEADSENEIVYLTDSMFDLLGIQKGAKNTLPLLNWQSLLTDILNDKEEGFEDVYRYNPSPKNVRWLRVKKTKVSPHLELGIVLDVSGEVIHQRQNEFERDYDQVTGFMNRKAFLSKCAETIDCDPKANGILLLADLYFIHRFHIPGEMENEVLLQAASLFAEFRQFGGILSRISDYEFAVYIHHYESLAKIMDFAGKQFGNGFMFTRMDGQNHEFLFSVGTSLFPEDAKNVEDLLTLADFAQKEAQKLPQKGIVPFRMEHYRQNTVMAQKDSAFYSILSSERLGVYLSPILDANTGNIMGYDALISSNNSIIKKTEELIALARLHNRLFELERLSLVSILDFIQQNRDQLAGLKVFFSSLTNEIIPPEEIQKIDNTFGTLDSIIVFNLADTEHCDRQIFITKNKELKKRGIDIAIDRYGTAGASELLLLDLNPSFLRLDPSIIQDVNLDPNRHQLLQALLSYATTSGIKTVAVGIRSREELETVIKMGINYVCGPYLYSPVMEVIPPAGDAVQEIRRKVKDASTYKFTLEDGEERFDRLLSVLSTSSPLTEREKVILLQICRGELNNVISSNLSISANTLKTHIRNIYSKFNVRNRKELLILSECSGRPDSELTLREKEILRFIIQGKTNHEIVSALCISNNTVRVHIWNICSKLGVKNRKDLMEIHLYP